MSERLPSTSEALDAWLDDLTLTASPATVRTYRALLRGIPDELSPAVCRSLVVDRFRRQSPATARTFRAALGSFCAWMVDRGILASNPVAAVPRPKGPSREPRVLSRPQLRACWLSAHDDTDRLLLLLLGAGMRRSEALSLRREDIDGDGTARIVGKGRKPRRIPLNEACLALLPASGPVLTVGRAQAYARVKAIGKRAGVPWLHPHALRHSFATWFLLESPGDMEHLRTLGGWSDHSPMPRHYARRALEESAIKRAREIDLDLFKG